MKRPLALLLAAALLFALCACGAQPDALTQPQTTEPTTAAPTVRLVASLHRLASSMRSSSVW